MKATITIHFKLMGGQRVNEELIIKSGANNFEKSASFMMENVTKSIEKFLKQSKIDAKCDFWIDYAD